MKITFADAGVPAAGVVVVFAAEGGVLGDGGQRLDRSLKGGLVRALKAGQFQGRKDQTATLLAPVGTRYERILVVGLGKLEEIDSLRLQGVGGLIHAQLERAAESAIIVVDRLTKSRIGPAAMAAEIAFGAKLRSYQFDKYRTKEEKDQKPILRELRFACQGAAAARAAYAPLGRVAEGVFFTRDLVSEPPNILYPETLAREARSLAKLGVKVEVLGVREMRRLGMGALLGVGQGSSRESKLVVMQWNGLRKSRSSGHDQPLAFIGKGVTFDTGGISIKPAANMHDMKWDMAGSAVVIGLMKALAGRRAKVKAVGVVGLVENMPDGNAQRPGDIVTSMSGQTIEIQNTDAEGRLVLADALWYCNRRFKPRFMVDLATLTGAIIISLGHEMAGMFTNNDELGERLTAAGKAVGELVWRMPLADAYDRQIRSDVADMKNIGGRGAGSVTAAQFLQRFVEKTPWAHLDIAGVAWSDKDKPTVPKGGTAFGVRLLDRLIAEHYEAR